MKTLTDKNGHSFTLTWPQGKTLAQAAAPLLAALLSLRKDN